MAHLSLALLGPLRILVEGRPVDRFAYTRSQALLAYLAVESDRPHRRDALVGLLWPELPDTAARVNLRQVLADLRQVIGDQHADPPLLLVSRETIQLNPQAEFEVDTARIRSLLAACAAHPHRDGLACSACARRLEQVLELYHGEFLAQLALRDSAAWEEWAVLQRESLHQWALEAAIRLAAYWERRGDGARARPYLQRQIELDPWREEAYRGLMRLHAAAGERSAALEHYERCKRVLSEGLGVEPARETVALYEQIRDGSFAAAVPGRGAPMPTNLHAPPGRLIGRDSELRSIQALLTGGDVRMVTLLGPPGVGKTRLGLEAASGLRFDFPDGVFLVELAPLRDATEVGPAIAEALGVRESGTRTWRAALVERLRERQTLLLLDNFEHVLDGATLVAELLAACPGLHILATSRAPLAVRAEHRLRVEPLALPAEDQAGDPEAVVRAAAVALFADRARAVGARFEVDSASAMDVAAICRRLDGLPLAIELVAAHADELSPGELLSQLERRLPFLAGGPRDLPSRQRTLRDAIAWSYELLSPERRDVFARLGVFAGGITQASAEAVCGPDAAPALAELQHASLLNRIDGLQPRWTLLETVREYAEERLLDTAEPEQARRCHALTFLELAERAAPAFVGKGQAEWSERLRLELPNLRAALRWAADSDEGDILMLMCAALGRFWELGGLLGEGIGWIDAALRFEQTAPPAVVRQVLHAAGTLAYRRADYAAARAFHERALELARGLEDRVATALSLNNLGIVAVDVGDYAAAKAFYERSLALRRALGNPHSLGSVLNNLADVAYRLGDLDTAAARYAESLEQYRAEGDTWSEASVLSNLGGLDVDRGELEAARRRFEQSLALWRSIGDTGMYAELGLGHVAFAEGDYAAAEARYRGGLAQFWRAERLARVNDCLEALARVAAATGRLERAAQLWGAAEGLRERYSFARSPKDIEPYRRDLAVLHAALGPAAGRWWDAGRALGPEQAVALALT